MSRAALALLMLANLRIHAQTAQELSEQGDRFAQSQQMDKAAESWRQAVEKDARYFPALFNLGYHLYTQHRFVEAETFLQKAADAQPSDFKAWYLLGAARSQAGQVDTALEAWRRALTLQPQNQRLVQIMAVEYAKGRYFGEANALAQLLLQQNRSDPNIFFLAIKSAQDAGDYETAASVAQKAVLAFPTSARANFEYAFHLKLQGKTELAIDYLRRAMQADPSYEEPPFLLGNLLVDQGHDAEAVPYLRAAIQDRHDFVPARVVLARSLMNQKQWSEAIAELEQTIALDPKHPQPHLLLSQIYFRLGEEDKANAEKQTSLRLRRENPTVLEAIQSRPFPSR